MNKDEAQITLEQIVIYFDLPGKPDWNQHGVSAAWFDMLAPFSFVDASAAVLALRARIAERLDKEERVYFPLIDEFGNFARKTATARERQAMARSALDSAIHCDGSRWIENRPDANGRLPWPDLDEGAVACPTCNPTNYSHQRGGHGNDRLDTKGVPASPPACRSRANEFVGERPHQQRWSRTLAAFARLPISYRRGFQLPEPDDGNNLDRLETFVADAPPVERGTTMVAPRARLGRTLAELEADPADARPRPEDRMKSCGFCAASVTRTAMDGWWSCANGHTIATGDLA